MEERNVIILSLAFERLEKDETPTFDRSAADRLKQLFVPGVDVYSALLHYHSKLMVHVQKIGFKSHLLKELEKILYAGMPKNYSEFNDKVDKEILYMFSTGPEQQKSK